MKIQSCINPSDLPPSYVLADEPHVDRKLGEGELSDLCVF